MSWLANLYKTYEKHTRDVGQFEKKKNNREYALIPVSHTTQSAHIEVNLDGEGNYLSAKVIDKNEGSTIIPCTEASASRTSAPVPYPLFDKLVYVAGDFVQYCGEVKGTPHTDYMKQLRSWCESPYGHSKVKCVHEYLAKGTLITDLIRDKVLWIDSQGKLIEKWTAALEAERGEKPDIFKVIVSDQSAAFIRFAVQVPGEVESRLWRDPSVQQSFIQFYEMSLVEKDLCYVSGELLPYADKHTSRIRNSADKSKLISANDSDGFTYRGRFRSSRDAAMVSYEVSQKAHNALKWLIERQGITVDGRVFLVWGIESLDMPDPLGDTFSLYQDEDEEPTGGDSTHKEFANQVRRAIGGYRYDGDYASNVIIMVLDAATPGRLAMVYYRDLNKEMFLDRLQAWHETCYWQHRYRKSADNKNITFIGAPATRDIAFAAYGPRANDKIVKGLIERMLPCIIDGRKIPLDIVRCAVNRASNPVGLDEWEWEKTLSITCALVNKTFEREGFEVALNTENKDRSYLFGRMLAIADVLERRALGREEKRATNAVRYMNAFAQRPSRTWMIIQSNIQPYQARMGTDAGYYNRLLDEVGAQLEAENFTDKPLSGLYLLGFYSQRNDLYTSKKDKEIGTDTEQDQENNEQGEIV
ncbi:MULTISPECIES: type I-C CRISPR-associated protein Cas8c/Csd1 [unclassified Paenibacillus]|uniref:type I-C CRISPR-associated protein Cas8c/Csd1 n=1 Tax=unclassified Paenibacillus TaxID=185978 RepID=UPI00048DD07B|nr:MULTISPECIES: type I-C CRISPR-associated protein Cas8c/Csd1 [unclassified Paenibacillus]SFQ96587.1 CRISPR-associated protein, Csd1 family [Paenibacillus sp. cl130]